MYSLLCGKAAATELVIKNECAAAVRKLYRPPIRPSDWPGVLFKPPVKPGMAWTGGEIDLRGAAIGAMFAGTAAAGRDPGENLQPLRLLLFLLRFLAAARRDLRARRDRALSVERGQLSGGSGQQRRVPAAVFLCGRRSRPRH